jgi:mono/diheme cytochrome c family protein
MTQRSFLVGCTAALSLLVAAHAQTRDPGAVATPTVASPPAIAAPGRPVNAPAAALRQSDGAGAPTLAADTQQAFLDQWCLACHSERARAAGLDSARRLTIDSLDPADVDADRETWELIVRKVRAGQMPPLGTRRPEPAEFDRVIGSIELALDRTATPYTPPPGLHRLNRTEYANVVRDLLDLEIDPSRYLPSDDSTSGFDNIAGALGISSTLVEAYVSAAQKISRLAMGYPEEAGLVVYRTREDTSQDYHVEGLPFGTRGGMLVRHVFPSDGEYTVTVTPIFGDNMSPTGFGSVPCEQLEISLDGERLELMDWRGGGRFGRGAADCGNRGPQPEQRGGQAGPEAFFGGRGGSPMQVRIATTAGVHAVAATFPATHYAPLLDLDRHFMRSTVQTGPTPGYTFFPHVGTIRIEGPFDATPATDTPSRRKLFVCTPAGPAEEASCARQIVTALATRAFRRPATDADVDLLMGFYEFGRQEKDFDYGIEMALARVLASPQFIYRIEEEPAAARQAYRISDVDLASRLSFFLWSSAPDEELLRVAADGRLGEPAELEAQVRRMLAHPKAEALAVNFAGQWLNLRALEATSPLPLVYPDFDDPLRQAMRREVELLFDTIVREDRSILDLLTADYTFVNERLAKHYGIRNVYGSHFRRVSLGPDLDTRRGLLGKGAFLATTSKPERTSPVTRGKWILTNVLGMSPPDPPADVPPLPPRAADPNAREPTMRQKMLDHRVRPDCVQCHRLMDPLGFALEPFDAIGLERTLDEGTVIDAATQVFDNSDVNGPAGLREWLADGYSDQFVTVATEKLLTYALGRGVDYRDMPLVRAIARQAREDDGRFATLVLGVVRSDPFQMNARDAAPGTSASTAEAAATRGPDGNGL